MGRKRVSTDISKSRIALNTPEDIWTVNELQFKIPHENVDFVNGLSSDSYEGFDSFCQRHSRSSIVEGLISQNMFLQQDLLNKQCLQFSSSTNVNISESSDSKKNSIYDDCTPLPTSLNFNTMDYSIDEVTEQKLLQNLDSLTHSTSLSTLNMKTESDINRWDSGFIHKKSDRRLAKLGRCYEDVWKEQNFIDKYGLTIPVLYSLDDLINPSPHENNSKSDVLIDNNLDCIETQPYARCHPAAISSSKNFQFESRMNITSELQPTSIYEIIHPASTAASISQPLSPKISCIKSNSRHISEFSEKESVTTDEIELSFSKCCDKLDFLESSNLLLLQKIQIDLIREISLKKLVDARKSLESIILSIFNNMESHQFPKLDRSLINNSAISSPRTSKCKQRINVSNELQKNINGIGSNSRCTRLQSSTDLLVNNEVSSNINSLGATHINDVKFATFIQELDVGHKVEIMIGTCWTVGLVTKIKQEKINRLRYFKVQIYGSYVGDSYWIAVEDGRLAPLGSYITKSCYDLMELEFSQSVSQESVGINSPILTNSLLSDIC